MPPGIPAKAGRKGRVKAVKYPKYATTVVGAHSVPDWYEALDRLVAVGQLSMASMADAQYRATEAAVLDQEIAAIDVITGGEMHRRTRIVIWTRPMSINSPSR
jgi:methionine synthase II (cobalamin-independent)